MKGGSVVKRQLWPILMLLLLPLWAWAEPATPYDPALMIYYPRLTQSQQQVFDLAYAGAAAGKTRVELPPGTSYDDACAAMDAMLMDCPELCDLGGEYSVGYYRSAPGEAIHIDLNYVLPLPARQEVLQTAAAMADQAYGDEFERELVLHDMLCDRVTYDGTGANAHNAYGALAEGRAVCDGYAKAMTLLLRLTGLECGVAHGRTLATGASHAWNLVRVDGAYTWLDVTNDDQPDLTAYFYYNITDEWLARSHQLLTEGLPPCGDQTVNWHVRNWRYVTENDDMQKHVHNNFRNMQAYGSRFCLRFERETDYLSLRDGVYWWAISYNKTGEHALEGQLHSYYDDAQRCVIVQFLR